MSEPVTLAPVGEIRSLNSSGRHAGEAKRRKYIRAIEDWYSSVEGREECGGLTALQGERMGFLLESLWMSIGT